MVRDAWNFVKNMRLDNIKSLILIGVGLIFKEKEDSLMKVNKAIIPAAGLELASFQLLKHSQKKCYL